MAGTVEGGKKTAVTNRQRYGMNFYNVVGAMGGRASNTGGFAATKVGKDGLTGQARARISGQKGGQTSRRHRVNAQT